MRGAAGAGGGFGGGKVAGVDGGGGEIVWVGRGWGGGYEVEVGVGEAAEFGVGEDFDGADVGGVAEVVDGQVGEGVGYGLEFDGLWGGGRVSYSGGLVCWGGREEGTDRARCCVS